MKNPEILSSRPGRSAVAAIMRTKTSLPGITLLSLAALLLLDLYPAGAHSANHRAISSQAAVTAIERSVPGRNGFISKNDALPAASANEHPATTSPLLPLCPPPSVNQGSQCVLKADFVLDQSLVLPSNTTLNCQGHKLIGPKIGSPVSFNQVGIFLNDVRNVRIFGCVIEGFDFGIFAINSKRPTPGGVTFKSFLMSNNNIVSRNTSVSLMSVDNAEIINNIISYTRAGGRALYIGRNSDSNRVLNNHFLADLVGSDANAPAFRVPGPESPATNPAVKTRSAVVVITQIEVAEPTLLNAIINNKLFQLSTTNSLTPNSDFSENNRLEGNTIRFLGLPVDGVALAVPQSTQVIGNTIEGGGDAGIRVGIQNDLERQFPGTCTSPLGRLCLVDEGCRTSVSDTATCTLPEKRIVKWISRDTRVETNSITGPLGTGIATAGLRTTIIGNTVVGPLRDATTGSGLRLITSHALGTTTVKRNSVSNVAVVLEFIQNLQCLQPTSFKAEISLNDFTAYVTAVKTTRAFPATGTPSRYDLKSELSVAGRGNFWETASCVGLDPTKVRNSEDNLRNPNVTDSHPYNRSVANTPFGLLPNPCQPIVSSP